MMATAIAVIDAILGFLKIRMSEAKSRTVVLKKNGINATDRSVETERVSSPAGV